MVRRTKAEAEQTRLQIIDAARRVFHTHGVARSTLEQIAREAGVTRGAVYWHFQDKQDLFFAMREQATLPLVDQVDESLVDESLEDPLEGIRIALLRVLTVLEGDPAARETFQIMIFRCEYVAEFAPVLVRINASCDELGMRLERAYRRAAERGQLRAGLDPALLARDTVAFLTGTIDRWLAEPAPVVVTERLRQLVDQHVALRRPEICS
jgi:TetR/AcrR family transcriptional regulator, acrAB operon repressor